MSFLELAPLPGAIPCARLHAVHVLHEWGLRELADDAALVVSELASNAVLHARSGFTATIDRGPDGVRVAVADPDAVGLDAMARSATYPPLRGLGIVDAVARQWGIDQVAVGKVVWAELARA